MAKKAVLTEYSLVLSQLRQPLTIAHVSDLHERDAADILSLLQAVRPDLIAVTGDSFERYRRGETDERFCRKHSPLRVLVYLLAYFANGIFSLFSRSDNRPDPDNVRRFMEQAVKTAPVFVSLGNHEEVLTEEDHAMLQACGATLLDNAGADLSVGDTIMHIGGLSTNADEEWLHGFVRQRGFKLLLCHHPEYYDKLPEVRRADLVLAGHNHGGQVRLFDKGLFSSSSGLLPKYDRGVFDGRMVVSAGCSNTFFVPRFGNPRELVVIRLEPENGSDLSK